MQSLFDPNEHTPQDDANQPTSPLLKLIVGLLLGILVVGGWIAYRYERELERQKDERCSKAHAELLASGVYGTSTAGIKEACGTDQLTPEEQAVFQSNKAKIEKSIREYECGDALQKYGVNSEVTKQHCRGTEIGKKVNF
jgi:hypothetical protein